MSVRSPHAAELDRVKNKTTALQQSIGNSIPTPAAPENLSGKGQVLNVKTSNAKRMMTRMVGHGDIYTLLDSCVMCSRLEGMKNMGGTAFSAIAQAAGGSSTMGPDKLCTIISSRAETFFTRLVPNRPLSITSSLMDYLVLPPEGLTYVKGGGPGSLLPVAYTFVGQFIDHDLTANAINLVISQLSEIENEATPKIDLDSVYGGRSDGAEGPFNPELFDEDGKFRLTEQEDGIIDFCRELVTTPMKGSVSRRSFKALIGDERNDENQLISQLHLLIMRVHNKFIDLLKDDEASSRKCKAREYTILLWQSVVAYDYLKRISQGGVYSFVLEAMKADDFCKLFIRPRPVANGKLAFRMSHEFAIGFRFGHSQLRSQYKLKEGGKPIDLFNNKQGTRDIGKPGFNDLRGEQKLTRDHQIDWSYWLKKRVEEDDSIASRCIDGKVTEKLFSLPESTIPDDISYISNLPHRNLIRSHAIGLCSGEDLCEMYQIHYHNQTKFTLKCLKPNEIEKEHPHLFMEEDGKTFRTPLWYYILKEAETLDEGQCGTSKLGTLGSLLVCETVMSAIRCADHSIFAQPSTQWPDGAGLPGDYEKITLADLPKFLGF